MSNSSIGRGVEKRNLNWREYGVWKLAGLGFLSPQNLNQWLGEDVACPLCSSKCSLCHILLGSKFSLSQGAIYTWHHHQVLKCLAVAIEDRQKEVNSQVSAHVIKQVNFVCEREKANSACFRQIFGQLRAGGAWELRVDIKQRIVVPIYMVIVTSVREAYEFKKS